MNKTIISLVLLLLGIAPLNAQDSYHIEMKIKGLPNDTCILAYRLGDKTYIQDTAIADKTGRLIFHKKKELPGGVYLALIKPKNEYFEFFVTRGQANFSVETEYPNMVDKMIVKNSKDNELFYSYINFLGTQRKKADPIREEMQKVATSDSKKKEDLDKKLKLIDDDVKSYQESLIKKNPTTFTAKMILANNDPIVPETEKKAAEAKGDSSFAYRYYKNNFWKNFDFSDERFMRSPIFQQKMDRYLDQLVIQNPDSLNKECSWIIEKARANKENFKFGVSHLLNKYAASKIVGMDAIYVYLAERYYATGEADWVEKETLDKIVDQARKLKPVLLGTLAPNFTIGYAYDKPTHKFVEKRTTLYDFKAEYTVLFFWKPKCSHCQKMTASLKEAYPELKKLGVEVFAVSTAKMNVPKEVEEALEDLKEKNVDWLNTADFNYQSRAQLLYNVEVTPFLFILDKDKKIISKRIEPNQIKDAIEFDKKIKKQKN